MNKIAIIVFASIAFCGSACGELYSTTKPLEIDTCVAAWLMKQYVDQDADFLFFAQESLINKGIPFDTKESEIRRIHDQSASERLIELYKIDDNFPKELGRITHDIEINFWQEPTQSKTRQFKKDVQDIINSSSSPEACLKSVFAYIDNMHREISSK